MLNTSIGRFDGGHCLGRVGVSANRHIVVGELQVEARESDTHYSLAIATAVSLSCPCGTESWWAAGDIYMSVGRVEAHARFVFTKTQKGYAGRGYFIGGQIYDMQKRAKLARRCRLIFCAVYLVATYLTMLNTSIGRFDGGHCLGRVGVSANRHIVVGELQVEARESDTGLVNRVYRQGQLECQKRKISAPIKAYALPLRYMMRGRKYMRMA